MASAEFTVSCGVTCFKGCLRGTPSSMWTACLQEEPMKEDLDLEVHKEGARDLGPHQYLNYVSF